jgi:hypothetical protein
MKSIKYQIEKKAKEGYEYQNGFFTYGYETNKNRAIKMAEEIVKNDKREARVRTWCGQLILELKPENYNKN